jgi:hypothetical protein
MSRFPFFMIAAFFACLGMVGFSLRDLLPTAPKSVEARNSAGTLLFDTRSLNAIIPANGFPVTPAPGPRGDQSGPRIAAVSALAPDATNSKGARLKLGPRTSASLTGRPVSVIITMRAIPNSGATNMAIGSVSGGPVNWTQAPVPKDFAPVRIDLPATGAPMAALAIWPATEGGGKGIEIRTIALQTATP